MLLTIVKEILLQWASEQVREPWHHPGTDRDGPWRATLSNTLHQPQQVHDLSPETSMLHRNSAAAATSQASQCGSRAKPKALPVV